MILLTQTSVRCHRCRQQLVLRPHLGWVHSDGGRYVFRCLNCDLHAARDPLPAVCPQCCHRRSWRLDHPALPEAG